MISCLQLERVRARSAPSPATPSATSNAVAGSGTIWSVSVVMEASEPSAPSATTDGVTSWSTPAPLAVRLSKPVPVIVEGTTLERAHHRDQAAGVHRPGRRGGLGRHRAPTAGAGGVGGGVVTGVGTAGGQGGQRDQCDGSDDGLHGVGTGGTPGGFVRGLYRDVLGREAGDPEVAGWVGLLATAPRSSVALAIAGSEEAFLARISEVYQARLRRQLSATDRQLWADQYRSGLRSDEAAFFVTASPEYTDRPA